ncbi:hypothetical protein BV898_06499 [Hypsibius exemplaris]|uniref:Uncharacterized protein n=1 Tax=Hypsibius exemplaris TaxID=2072580 RepID=A0A1W0WWE7_HYPEX|nr:hypothetical protein BV898_06499 [Hypsibius exemplaris]
MRLKARLGKLQEARYQFVKDPENKKTWCSVRSSTASPGRRLYLQGILTIQHRLVKHITDHVATPLANMVSSITPLKSSTKESISSVAVIARFEWMCGQDTKTRDFLVPYEDRLNKSAYIKAKKSSGDEGATLAFRIKDTEIWTEFNETELTQFEKQVCTNPKAILLHWNRVGLQESNRRQEDDVFIWNSAVAFQFDRVTNRFVRRSLMDVGYFYVSKEDLPEVTVCLNDPTVEVAQLLCQSFGDVDFITFLCIAGQCLLALRPRFVHDVLQLRKPTTCLVGKSDSRKTLLIELALILIGMDRKTGHSFSYYHMSEFEFGKRTLKCTLPLLISDPPLKNSRQSRVGSRLIVLGVNSPINFPSKKEDIYRRAQSLSAHLPALLKFPVDDIRESVEFFTDVLGENVPADLADYGTLKRNLESLSLFYAFGEPDAREGGIDHQKAENDLSVVQKQLLPEFDFRGVAAEHMTKVALPSMSRYLVQVNVPRDDQDLHPDGPLSDIIESVVADTVRYALSHPNTKWYEYIQWNLNKNSNQALSIRPRMNYGLFGKQSASIRSKLKDEPVCGCYEKVNFVVPKDILARGQQSQYAVVFYVAELPIKTQHHLIVLGWETPARQCIADIDDANEADLDFAATGIAASQAAHQFEVDDTGSEEPADDNTDEAPIDNAPDEDLTDELVSANGSSTPTNSQVNGVLSTDSDTVAPQYATSSNFDNWFAIQGRYQAKLRLIDAGLEESFITTDMLCSVSMKAWMAMNNTQPEASAGTKRMCRKFSPTTRSWKIRCLSPNLVTGTCDNAIFLINTRVKPPLLTQTEIDYIEETFNRVMAPYCFSVANLTKSTWDLTLSTYIPSHLAK